MSFLFDPRSVVFLRFRKRTDQSFDGILFCHKLYVYNISTIYIYLVYIILRSCALVFDTFCVYVWQRYTCYWMRVQHRFSRVFASPQIFYIVRSKDNNYSPKYVYIIRFMKNVIFLQMTYITWQTWNLLYLEKKCARNCSKYIKCLVCDF